MLYYLFEFLETQYNLPGAGLFDYLSFRAAVSVIISLIISVVFGKRIIEYLRKRQIGENVRKLGLEGEEKKIWYANNGWTNNNYSNYNSSIINVQS